MYQCKQEKDIFCPLNTAWSFSAANGAPASSACSPRWTCRVTVNCARRWATSPTRFSASTLKFLILLKSYDEIPPRVDYTLSEKGHP